jgi:hypothetical protein
MDDREEPYFDSQPRQEISVFSTVFRPALGPTQPPIQCILWAVSTGHEADPASTKVKNVGAILPLPHLASRRGA